MQDEIRSFDGTSSTLIVYIKVVYRLVNSHRENHQPRTTVKKELPPPAWQQSRRNLMLIGIPEGGDASNKKEKKHSVLLTNNDAPRTRGNRI